MKCYYDIKYPYLQYSVTDDDGDFYMYSIPPILLAKTYESIFYKKPTTFFDCGAATGVIVQLALEYGMNARGIDIKKYPDQHQSWFYLRINKRCFARANSTLQKLFDNGRIEIKSILDCEPIQSDIAYCNGTLTYFDEQTLPLVLSKFNKVGMLCAIHNTTEDIIAAKQMGDTSINCTKSRIIKPNDWWIETFNQNGFNAELNENLRTFIAIPRHR